MVKKLKQQFETPNEAWSEDRMQREEELIEEFGLKNKEEVYKAESTLRGLRREARKLVAEEDESQKEALINKAHETGLVREDAELEDILTLNTTDILERRLQTVVNRRGYSDTVRQARQMVTHGHVYIDGERVTIPGYLLTQEEEKQIGVRMPEPDEEASGTESEEENEEGNEEIEETEEGEESETQENDEEGEQE
ncbi:MAG: 30S ribosomal protein S4 [Candidatus Nanohaloarchaea archaeon]